MTKARTKGRGWLGKVLPWSRACPSKEILDSKHLRYKRAWHNLVADLADEVDAIYPGDGVTGVERLVSLYDMLETHSGIEDRLFIEELAADLPP